MLNAQRHILITGAHGFMGKNLSFRLNEFPNFTVYLFGRENTEESLSALVAKVDVVVHLAGENRPQDPSAFNAVNVDLTAALCSAIRNEFLHSGRVVQLLFASSVQATFDNLYGQSKLAAEKIVQNLAVDLQLPVVVFRLPGVFGKWSKPNYNSVVATFCHNIARGLPIEIAYPDKVLNLVYIDDVIDSFLRVIRSPVPGLTHEFVTPEYSICLKELADNIKKFAASRKTLITERVGTGLMRALYATYISYLPVTEFSYDLPYHQDARGVFVEVLKTPDCGQVSYFTIEPDVTRGSHYHHTKTEKFVVLSGKVTIRFRDLVAGNTYEIITTTNEPKVVDTIPGWVHEITNIGNETAIIMVWANELFDHNNPDCTACRV